MKRIAFFLTITIAGILFIPSLPVDGQEQETTKWVGRRRDGNVLSKENLSAILKEHKKWIESLRDRGQRADLSKTDLTGVDLSYAELLDANFEGAILNGADLEGALLDLADMRGAKLNKAKLRKANLFNANLNKADLREANLSNSGLISANLSEAILIGADLRETDLEYADLSLVELKEANLREANLRYANLRQANLERANLQKANLGRADLTWAWLIEADLSGADLREEANLSETIMTGVNLSMALLEGVNLEKAYLFRANLSEASLYRTKLRKADLREANLQGAVLNQADLREAILYKADLTGASLQKANLRKANLTEANMSEADLTEAKLVEASLWDADLTMAYLRRADLESLYYEPRPGTIPNVAAIGTAKNLLSMRFQSPHGIVELREAFKKGGLRKQEREMTFILERAKRIGTWKEGIFGKIESVFKLVLFELTCDYGMSPGRPLLIVGLFILLFSFPYMVALRTHGQDGIWRVWSKDRMRKDLGKENQKPLTVNKRRSIFIGLYFSVLSAFHIGWRDLNVGNWIARVQPREYTYRASGWVRMVSGIQSLTSVYLLALWLLNYFGRPFE